MDDALQARLCDAHDFCILQVLAKQHAESRRGHGAGLVASCQIDQGKRGVSRQKESVLAAVILDGQKQLVALRLGNFIDSSAQECFMQFTDNVCNGNTLRPLYNMRLFFSILVAKADFWACMQ